MTSADPAAPRAPDHRLLVAGPALALLTITGGIAGGLPTPEAVTLGVTLWCALWWVTEAVPMAVTGLLPLALFPLLGVITPAQAAQAYGSPLILLLLGGFILSKAMERSGAHRRIALLIVRALGADRPARVLLGLVLASGLLSMWISNTATTLMLLPVAAAALGTTASPALATALFLGIAYGASVGGIGTPVGTPPNLVFLQVYGQTTGTTPGFLAWMSWGLPVALLGLPVIALWLGRRLDRGERLALPEPGPWQAAERRVLTVFATTAVLWITRSEPFGGWSSWLALPRANDASVALLAVVTLFLVPDGRGSRLLSWDEAARIPWGVLLLFAGGIAIASAFVASGLSVRTGALLVVLLDLPRWAMLLLIALGVSFLTEVTSNTATTNLLMPILAAAGVAAGVDPAILMVPAAMSASCAFMLPVATAPNAIVYGSGRVTARAMAREGLALNLLLAGLVALVCGWRLG